MVNPGFVFCLFAVAVSVSGQNSDDDSSFAITNVNRRANPRGSGSSSSRLTSGRGRGGSSGGAFPDYVRIEVEIIRLENPGGILGSGKRCDFTRKCDPKLTAYIDTSRPLAPWPGSVPVKKWPIIFRATDNDSPQINKVLNTDICGGSVNKINVRVQAVDEDSISSNDDMNDFECTFDINPRDIALDASSVDFGPETQCKSSKLGDKIKLFARERAYQIPAGFCRAQTSG